MSNKEQAQIATAKCETAAFTVDEVATYFRISRASVWRLLKSGALARARIGGRTVIRRLDADAFLARAAKVA
ncbi:helix-turn-helix domain-containing protein [Methylobacterium sp. Leaf466]|uniref:helix-turn-helix domain-containing protein n=1 Tax=Methylobacterium sp. Leaf466 TaxID=1736386 RepID=UPI0009ECAE5B|nr:helix-turn-helix domain-containing protein [Methylobacterium sp. Leaf466]